MPKKYIVANWKENPSSEQEALALVQSVGEIERGENVEVIICPPFIYLDPIEHLLKSKDYGLMTKLGAQDDSPEQGGAHTGEVSPTMLKDLGVQYVILGHSERRARGETDDMIAKKVFSTLEVGLTPILCVGEPLAIREQGTEMSKKFVAHQLSVDLDCIKNLKFKIENLLIAYEPVWAISTNPDAKPDTPENAVEMINYIKELLKSKDYSLSPVILYGGSVNGEDARGFLEKSEIEGALIGGASLRPDEFKKIISIASELVKS